MPIEHPRLPDVTSDKVECMGEGEVKAEVLRGLDEIETADGCGNKRHGPGEPLEPPDGAEEGTQPLGTAHNVAC